MHVSDYHHARRFNSFEFFIACLHSVAARVLRFKFDKMSSDSDDNKPEPSTKRKRGVRRTSEYKSEVIKRARLQGAAYTNWKGRNVPPVVVALDSKCG